MYENCVIEIIEQVDRGTPQTMQNLAILNALKIDFSRQKQTFLEEIFYFYCKF